MHGSLSPLLYRATAWQRALLGVALAALGLFTGATMMLVVSGVIFVAAGSAAIRSRPRALIEADRGSHSAAR